MHIQYARRIKIVTCTAKDHTGTIMLVWYNMPYLKKQLHQGRDYIFTGTPIYKNGRITMEHPEIFTPEDYEAKQETLQPVYPLTSGLTNKLVSKAMFQTKDYIFRFQNIFHRIFWISIIRWNITKRFGIFIFQSPRMI